MTLKEELEILRGEPIRVWSGDPMEIPCIETSDPEKLCKHPVVSVHMITYNHELYIRQAIEGVMMQETDFEFELVIGEDCSTDKTREICFEYQKKYPDKIRVLWWHKNLYRNPHSAGGNGKRNTVHCRGEFIAFCEGDDYWIDPLKLQKQVDVMRKHLNVGLCATLSDIYYECIGKTSSARLPEDLVGLQKGKVFMKWLLCGVLKPEDDKIDLFKQIYTPSVLVRANILAKANEAYDIMQWKLSMSDTTTWLALASLSDFYLLKDVTSCYRVHMGGVSQAKGRGAYLVALDGLLARLYFATTEKSLEIFCRKHILKGILRQLIIGLRWLEESEVRGRTKDINEMEILESARLNDRWSRVQIYIYSLPYMNAVKKLSIIRFIDRAIRAYKKFWRLIGS